MKLKTATALHGTAAAGTTSYGSNLVGRKYWVVSTRYGNSPAAKFPTRQDGQIVSGPYDTAEEAQQASLAMPYTKVTSQPQLEQTPAVRDIARRRMVQTNPDVDAASLEDVKGIISFQGLKIRIENPRGSTRSGTDKQTGRKWSVNMSYPYGEILGTDGVDGDPVDCFIGPDANSKWVHVIHIQKSNGDLDEDKCMLGWADARLAKKALMENYDAPHFYGGMDTMAMDEFKRRLKDGKVHGPKLIRAARMFKVGDEVFYDGGHANKGVVRKVTGRRVIIQTLANLVVSRDIGSVHHWDENHVSKSWSGNGKKRSV